MVPNGWNIKTLDSVSKITRLAGAEYSDVWATDPDGEIIALRGYNIENNKVNLRDVERITQEMSMRLNRSKLYKNDIVFPCVGSIGKAYLVEEDNKFHINQNIAKITPSKELAPLFLTYCLLSNAAIKQILKFNTSSSQPNVLVGNLRKFQFAFPDSKSEQRKIAKILSTWDKAISTTERLIDNSKQQKKALMQQLLTGAHTQRKRLLDDSGKPFEGEWEAVKLGDLSTKITKGTTPSTNGFSFQQHGINFVKVESISSTGAFNKSKFAYIDNDCHESFKRSQLEKDDILFSIAGALGRTAIVEDSILPANTNQALAIVRLGERLSEHRYINYYLNSPRITSLIKGLTAKAAQPNLSLKDVNSLTILLPSLKEQGKIAAVLTNADKETELLQQQLTDLKKEKKALMQQLLTGKRRVKVNNTEAA
ncbi:MULTISPECIES: restriction endonuclease subunit S [unclassified Pseudoalteromonas]|uniref:restriction endonuclease subunit S n=1 Tax=unclassified Pseudoalteromonas TaxID=194690 RepID=UPI00041240D8|nr:MULTISPECIES: restriction endonuclease subunit S [unclassified Pseudoalteromonas]TMP83382.1 restriction endonuclease subunit S [Pseudoalteromonas sp. S983]